jgi:hypothetical protein
MDDHDNRGPRRRRGRRSRPTSDNESYRYHALVEQDSSDEQQLEVAVEATVLPLQPADTVSENPPDLFEMPGTNQVICRRRRGRLVSESNSVGASEDLLNEEIAHCSTTALPRNICPVQRQAEMMHNILSGLSSSMYSHLMIIPPPSQCPSTCQQCTIHPFTADLDRSLWDETRRLYTNLHRLGVNDCRNLLSPWCIPNPASGWTSLHYAAATLWPEPWWNWVCAQGELSESVEPRRNPLVDVRNWLGQSVVDIFVSTQWQPLPWQAAHIQQHARVLQQDLETITLQRESRQDGPPSESLGSDSGSNWCVRCALLTKLQHQQQGGDFQSDPNDLDTADAGEPRRAGRCIHCGSRAQRRTSDEDACISRLAHFLLELDRLRIAAVHLERCKRQLKPIYPLTEPRELSTPLVCGSYPSYWKSLTPARFQALFEVFVSQLLSFVLATACPTSQGTARIVDLLLFLDIEAARRPVPPWWCSQRAGDEGDRKNRCQPTGDSVCYQSAWADTTASLAESLENVECAISRTKLLPLHVWTRNQSFASTATSPPGLENLKIEDGSPVLKALLRAYPQAAETLDPVALTGTDRVYASGDNNLSSASRVVYPLQVALSNGIPWRDTYSLWRQNPGVLSMWADHSHHAEAMCLLPAAALYASSRSTEADASLIRARLHKAGPGQLLSRWNLLNHSIQERLIEQARTEYELEHLSSVYVILRQLPSQIL